ncbi:hypothetical protein D3C81_1321290 [compost metagenome]
MDFFVDLTSVGTFFAFILVCAGVLYMDYSGLSAKSKFKVPYINGKYLVGAGLIIAIVLIGIYGKDTLNEWKKLSILEIVEHKMLVIIFWLTWLGLSIYSFKMNFSLLPVIGILINLYLMTELGASNWIIFVIWLVLGLGVYFMYGYKHSKLNKSAAI